MRQDILVLLDRKLSLLLEPRINDVGREYFSVIQSLKPDEYGKVSAVLAEYSSLVGKWINELYEDAKNAAVQVLTTTDAILTEDSIKKVIQAIKENIQEEVFVNKFDGMLDSTIRHFHRYGVNVQIPTRAIDLHRSSVVVTTRKVSTRNLLAIENELNILALTKRRNADLCESGKVCQIIDEGKMIVPDRKEKFICTKCDENGYHRPVSIGQAFGKTSGPGPEWHYKVYEVLRCEHCENVVLCVSHWTNPGEGIGDSYITKKEFSPPIPFWKKPAWLPKLRKAYRQIFTEIYAALDSSLYILAASGIRTALDKLIVEKIGDIGGFAGKVEKLVEKGIITADDKELLLAVVDAGSASAHRGYTPSVKAITHMMEITEHIFFRLCFEKIKDADLLTKAKILRSSTPERKRHNQR